MGTRLENRFELSFRLSERRFEAAHRAYLRHTLLTVKNLFLVTMALGIGVVQSQMFGGAAWAVWVFGGIWLTVVFLVILAYLLLPARIYRRVPSRSLEQNVIVDGDGVDWKAGESHRVILWKEIDRASDIHPDFVFLHPKHGLLYVIPKDVFGSDEELRAFDRFVHQQISQARA